MKIKILVNPGFKILQFQKQEKRLKLKKNDFINTFFEQKYLKSYNSISYNV